MNKLKDIVEQVQETPSPRCWESIASQLPAAGTAIGGGTAATAAKGTIAAGKLAAIIGSATAVVTVATIATVSLLKNEAVPETQLTSDNPTQIIISDSISTGNTDTYLVESESATQNQSPISPAAGNANEKADPVVVNNASPASSTETFTTNNNISTTSTTPTSSSANLVSNPSPTSSTNTQNTVIQNNTANTSTQTSPSNNKPEESTDKAEENHPETNINPEDFGYSRPVIIEIPNVFTPNGDGVNEHFVINGLDNCDKRMLVVKNQKGETVFQSNHYDNSWDGANLPDGSYYYQFMYSINNINEVRKGVVLIRR